MNAKHPVDSPSEDLMRKTSIYIACAAMALFAFTSEAAGNTYNVSTVAELEAAVNSVNGGTGGDVIVIAPGLYSLTGPLFLFTAVTIEGDSSSPSVIDGGGQSILITFSAATLSLQNLTLQNADRAITYDAAGVFSATGVTITGSREGFNGGDSGGSSFFTNSTIAHNDAGIRVDCASLTLTNVTVSDNGTGVDFSSCGEQMTFANSLIVRNTTDCSGGGITAVGDASIDSDGTCSALGFGPGLTTQTVASVMLGILAANGGPTLTESISSPSVAIDKGDIAMCPATDQRGFLRDSNCDIGAFEFVQPGPPLPLVKSQCMNGGWRNYAGFKNQGDCIQFVNTGK
jgi:Periplasmic copper-binding protein (NosD)